MVRKLVCSHETKSRNTRVFFQMAGSDSRGTAGISAGTPAIDYIYINDLDEGTKYNISKFVDDTKLGEL